MRERLAAETGLAIGRRPTRSRRRRRATALVEASGALKAVAVSLTKIANDLRLMGSGPRAGLAEIFLPELQKGSSIMPGKVNPVIPEVVTQVAAQVIGNDAAITVGGMQGHFELNIFVPLMARNLLDSIRLLASASRLLAERCVDGIEANREQCERYAELTLSAATALNPYIGYDKAARDREEGRRVRAARCARSRARPASTRPMLDEALDYRSDGEAARLEVSVGLSPFSCRSPARLENRPAPTQADRADGERHARPEAKAESGREGAVSARRQAQHASACFSPRPSKRRALPSKPRPTTTSRATASSFSVARGGCAAAAGSASTSMRTTTAAVRISPLTHMKPRSTRLRFPRTGIPRQLERCQLVGDSAAARFGGVALLVRTVGGADERDRRRRSRSRAPRPARAASGTRPGAPSGRS